MKKEIFLGLLVVLGLSFAQPSPSGPVWGALMQTACQGTVAYQQTYSVVDHPYEMWDGEGCATPSMPFEYGMICGQICDYDGGGFYEYYGNMMDMCGEYGETSPQCVNAMVQFYSSAASARGMYSSTRTAYFLAARQAIFAYNGGYCESLPWPGVVSQDMFGFMSGYRECMQDPGEYMTGFCGYCEGSYSACDMCMEDCMNEYDDEEFCLFEICFDECGAVITP